MPRKRRRRGIVLLIVLSLLVLFTILMVTFLVVAGQYRLAARATSRSRQQVIEPDRMIEQAAYTLFRDTGNSRSVLRGHSLLLDMYGLDGFKGTVAGSGNVGAFSSQTDGTDGQFFDLRLNSASLNAVAGNPNFTLRDIDGYYSGCILTTVATSAQSTSARSRLGLSYRIVDYIFDPAGNNIFRLMTTSPDVATTQRPQAGDTVVINGRPFNGTGFGFDNDNSSSSRYRKLNTEALLPNQYGRSVTQFREFITGIPPNPNPNSRVTGPGDADEGYDAVDYQNMALAAVIPTIPGAGGAAEARNVPTYIIPSFHRPALINYWRNTAPAAQWPSLRGRMILRPMPWDHPDFTGGNSALSLSTLLGTDGKPGAANNDDDGDGIIDNPTELGWPGSDDDLSALLFGPWDVDTDGDGIKDSIWLDLDFPLHTTNDGRLIKPLFAIHCVDLDSRLNFNAHGSHAHIYNAGLRPAQITDATNFARNLASNTLPKGQGYGPPEIALGALFNSAQYNRLLTGYSAGGLRGRYGDDAKAGANGLDPLAQIKFFDIPKDYFNPSSASKAYYSAPDISGEYAIALDHRGQPTSDRPTGSDSLSDSPYEVDLSLDGPRGAFNPVFNSVTSVNDGFTRAKDHPFSVAELERVLRPYDSDTGNLPDRLVSVFSGISNPFTTSSVAAANRRIVTTDSYDLPVPSMLVPWRRRGDFSSTAIFPSRRPTNFLDMVTQRIYSSFSPPITNPTPAQKQALNALLEELVSPDLTMGLKMDLNRPFGNGLDDNGNGVIDEHGPTPASQHDEADPSINEKIWTASVSFDHDNDGNTLSDTDAYLARYHFARHLYVLAMTLKYKTSGGGEYQIDFDGDGSTSQLETARGIAQWAINVVDFRDTDSIMTPFEFDPDPFDGWNVDGNIATDEFTTIGADGNDNDGDGLVDGADIDEGRYIVWGCERPELLITETLAFHDRRTEDLDSPEGETTKPQPSGETREDDAEAADDDSLNDFDQRHQPRGHVCIELHNPWASDIERYPQEFYNGVSATSGIVLNRVNSAGSPVWRFAVTAYIPPGGPDIDDKFPGVTPPAIERVAYFSTTGPAEGTATLHFGPAGVSLAPILPGRYAVVGRTNTSSNINDPATGAADPAEYVALIGRRNDGTFNTNNTRRIVLHADAAPDANWVYVGENSETASWLPSGGVPSDPNYVADSQPAVAVPLLDFNVSQGPYPGTDANGVVFGTDSFNGEPGYTTPFDLPFDLNPAYSVDVDPSTAAVDVLSSEGTYVSFRTIHLQRLANPLLAYDATMNPYLTIDSMPVDLTVYNGINRASDGSDDPAVSAGDPSFESRQRGVDPNSDGDDDPVTNPWRNLWSPSTTAPGTTGGGAVANHYFNEEFKHTLGRLNEPFGAPFIWDYGNPGNTSAPSQTYVGAPDSRAQGTGVPPNPPFDRGPPFPWLTWHNRPFVSQYELLWVPYQRSSKLLSTFTMDTGLNPYSATSNAPAIQFGHLLNLFETSDIDSAGAEIVGSDLHWILEYTHVPSRFVQAETWLNPANFAGGTGTAGTEHRHPPFNRISNFRDPGKVNPNTVFDDRIWSAILGPNGKGPAFSAWVDSRRGYGSAGDGIYSPNASFPTFFTNPLRPSGASKLVPIATMERAESECGLHRSNVVDALTSPTSGATTEPLFATTSGATAINPSRNAYFRYQSIQRFANLLTPRSNVYTVWITAGFFEVDPTTGRLRQEAGIETGEVTRHRAFYVFDRTIPVAWEPGENHNVGRAILLKRFIE